MSDCVKKIEDLCTRYRKLEGPLLPILHALQAEFGYIDAEAEGVVANALNLSRAEVHGVVSFYHDFLPAPDVRPVIEICRAEACKARGIDAMVSDVETLAAERVRLKFVYCLGLCSIGPAARNGDDLHARLDKDSLLNLVEQA